MCRIDGRSYAQQATGNSQVLGLQHGRDHGGQIRQLYGQGRDPVQ